MIEFDGEFELDLPPEEMWDYFTDPDVLAECAPGVDEMNVVGPGQIEAIVGVKVGSVNPSFDVDVTVVEAEYPSRLKLKAVGNANRNAFEGVATMDLAETDDGGTLATWSATAEVSGRIASLGQRALGSVTERLVDNFYEDLEEAAREGEPATSELEAAPEAAPDVAVEDDG